MEMKSSLAARQKLVHLLQNAYSGELAAFYAYEGHQKSLRDPNEKQEVCKIRNEEWESIRENFQLFQSSLKKIG